MKRKKKIVRLTIISAVFALLSVVVGALLSVIPAFKAIFGNQGIGGVVAIIKTLPHYLKLVFRPTGGSMLNITSIAFLLVVLLFVITGIILLFKIGYKKNVKAHGVWFLVYWLLLGLLTALFALALYTDGFLPTIGEVSYKSGMLGGFAYLFALKLNDFAFVNFLLKALGLLPIIFLLVADVLAAIAFIRDLSLLGKDAQELAYKEACEEAERNGEAKPEKPDELKEDKDKSDESNVDGGEGQIHGYADARGMIQGPILVQYINTQTGETRQGNLPATNNEPKDSAVSIEEVKAAISGQKQMSQDDIRKIIQEEFARERLENEVANSKKNNPSDISMLLKKQLDDEEPVVEEEPKPVIVPVKEPEPVKEEKPVEEKAAGPVQSISQEDIQAIIRDELLMFQQAQAEADEARKAEQDKQIQDERNRQEALEKAREAEKAARDEEYRRQLEETARLKAEKEAVEEALRKLQSQEAEKPQPEPVEPGMSQEDVKKMIAEALAEQQPAEVPESLSGEDIRAIIRDELAGLQPAPAPQPVVVQVAPAPQPEPAPAPAPEPAPVEEPQKRVVGAINPDLPPHDKIIRIPFPNRMVDADDLMKSNYNELKTELMAYGLKSRVSNSGDTFRLHKVTYVKITIAGKSLKLYMALDPKDYADSSMPVGDVSSKNTYKDIPFVFKVKSPLSMRRAKQLIADLMDKHDLEQAKLNPHNWADELKDYKPAGAKDDEE